MRSTKATGTVRGVGVGTGQVSVLDKEQEGRVVEYEPRVRETYLCSLGHTFTRDFHADLEETPRQWPCPKCSDLAPRWGEASDTVVKPYDSQAPVRPGAWYSFRHRNDVLGRRTRAELEALLNERRAVLRAMDPPSPDPDPDTP